ncbi:MAG TPA: (Fe-S)-binding protein [Hyphomicrobiaceae bacterium]|nr:(Fe-S)-binding protein [Hyphomicrobiaceae bacterium]
MTQDTVKPTKAPRVGLFVTCLVDSMRPSIGFATIKLLEDAGCVVEVPEVQTCCGQPAYNSGGDGLARGIVKQVIAAFEGFDYVVVPSGSCAGMLKVHAADLFEEERDWAVRHQRLADKTYEILSFLRDVLKYQPKDVRYEGVVTYHDSCSGLRELGIHEQPRALLDQVAGLKRVPLEGDNQCCGFGGTFCVKYPDISNEIVEDKTRCIAGSGADTLLAGDLGCLMNMAGKLSREGKAVRVFHTVEVLAGMADGAGLCMSDKELAALKEAGSRLSGQADEKVDR